MVSISRFEFRFDEERLKGSAHTGTVPEELLDPLRSLVTSLSGVLEGKPSCLYLFSSEEDKSLRDHFAILLALALMPRARTVVVDTDFLAPGMSGLVPHRDALGFLDLLLYGSSLSSIVQKTSCGVGVIGTGSFPVSRKMPFTMEPFEQAARYLGNQVECTIFTGPALGDEGETNPMAVGVGNVIYLRSALAGEAPPVDRVERDLREMERGTVVAAVLLREEVAAEPKAERELGEKVAEKRAREPVPREAKPGEEERPAVPPSFSAAQGGGSSLVPRVVTGVLALLLVAFLFWWLFITKPVREGEVGVARKGPEGIPVPVDTGGGVAAPVESAAAAGVTVGAVAESLARELEVPIEVSGEKGKAAPAAEHAAPSDTAPVFETREPLSGKYAVHVSSFRFLEKARDDARYLERKGHDCFILHVDLGPKGIWYRVYVGPMDAREEARKEKLLLEELSRVGYARIVKL